MKLQFKISKLANQFFFVDNLSEWNIYCRRNYNKEWLNRFGKLTKKEKVALKNYRLLMRKYREENLYKKIRNIFYSGRYVRYIERYAHYNDGLEKNNGELRKKIKKLILIKSADILFDSISTFYPKFQTVWKKYQPTLSYNKKIILKNYKDTKNALNSIFYRLASFYGKEIAKQDLDVYLIISPVKNYQGGKAIDKNKISIELNKLDYENKNQLIAFWFLVVHETIHAIFENQEYKKWIKQFIKQQSPLGSKSKIVKKLGAKEVLREIITATATTAADLLLIKITKEKIDWQKILKKQLKTSSLDDLNTLRRWAVYDLRETINKYLNNKRKIDKPFLKKCWTLNDNYPENLLQEIKNK